MLCLLSCNRLRSGGGNHLPLCNLHAPRVLPASWFPSNLIHHPRHVAQSHWILIAEASAYTTTRPDPCMACAGAESMPDLGLGDPDLDAAELLSSADLPPMPGYGQLPGDPLRDAGKSPAYQYDPLLGSPGDFLTLGTPKGGSLSTFAGAHCDLLGGVGDAHVSASRACMMLCFSLLLRGASQCGLCAWRRDRSKLSASGCVCAGLAAP